MHAPEQILDALATIDDTLARAGEVESALGEVVRSLLDIFACDRAYLRLLDRVEGGGLFEPIVFTRSSEGEMRWRVLDDDDFGRSLLALARGHALDHARDHDGRRAGQVVRCGPGGLAIPADSQLATLGVASAMLAVFKPRLGPAFVVGIHDCARAREYDLERRLLARIGARMADAVTQAVTVQHLQQSEARARVLLEHAAEAIVLIDVGSQRIVDSNSRAEQLLGLAPGHLLGTELSELSHEPDDYITERLAEAAAGATRSFAWTVRRSDGGSLPCAVELVALPDSERLIVRAHLIPLSRVASRS
jgi:PAS domain S-box-containing protein